MIQEQVSSTNQGGRGCGAGGEQRERAVTPFVESSLDWKSTGFEMLFGMSSSKSPKPPKVSGKLYDLILAKWKAYDSEEFYYER